MEEITLEIENLDTRAIMQEALSCYMSSAYRGCIVLTFIALFDQITRQLRALSPISAEARDLVAFVDERERRQEIYETDLINQLASKKLINELDKQYFDILRTSRNKCAHPSGHAPSAEEARFVYVEAIRRFLSKPVLTVSPVIDEIIRSLDSPLLFVVNEMESITAIVSQEITTLSPDGSAMLVTKLLDEEEKHTDATVKSNAARFLMGLSALRQPHFDIQIKKRLLQNTRLLHILQDTVLSVLDNNISLLNGLERQYIDRIRTLLNESIGRANAPQKGRSGYPVGVVFRIVKEASDDIVADFEPEITKAVLANIYDKDMISVAFSKPNIRAAYLAKLQCNASSSTFVTANTAAAALRGIDTELAAGLTDNEAFCLLAGIAHAALLGAFEAINHLNGQFATLPAIRQRAQTLFTGDPTTATDLFSQLSHRSFSTAQIQSYIGL
jgi:hypothetical protein